MDENKFWLRIWQTSAIAFVCVVGAGVTSCQMTKQKIVAVVQSGADPLEARCAIDSGSSHDLCTALVAKP